MNFDLYQTRLQCSNSCNIQGCSHETPAFKLESVSGELRAAALQSCVFIRAFGAKRYEWVDGSRLGPAGGTSGNTLGTRRDEGREDAVAEPHWDWQVVGSTPSRVRLKSLELVPFASLIGPQRSGLGGLELPNVLGPRTAAAHRCLHDASVTGTSTFQTLSHAKLGQDGYIGELKADSRCVWDYE